jgi:stress response protein SCP2
MRGVKLGIAAVAGAVLVGTSAAAWANDIAVFATGVGNDGKVLSVGNTDPHWSIVDMTGSTPINKTAFVAAAHPAYLPNSTVGTVGSSWIATTSTTNTGYAPGTYLFRTTFDLTGLDPSTASLSIRFAVDDQVSVVKLNGATTGITGSGFSAMSGPFTVAGGFVSGVNTLEFTVVNGGPGGNPSGFRALLSGTASPAVILDTTPPVLSGLHDVTYEATNAAIGLNAAVLGISADDDEDGPVGVALDPQQVSGVGDHVVTVTAEDAAGNLASDTFTVHVVDTTAPTLAGVPQDVLTYESTGAAIDLDAAALGISASDIVDGAVAVELSPSQVSGLGDHEITASATDAAGNTSSDTFTVHLADTTAPTVESLSVTPDTITANNHKMVDVEVSGLVSDANDAAPVLKIESITCDEDADAPGSGKKGQADWEITGDLTAKVRAERSGKGDGRTYTLLVSATDASGNVEYWTLTVDVAHDQGKGKSKAKKKRRR